MLYLRLTTFLILYDSFFLHLLEQSPDLFLDELAEELEVQHGVIVSISTVWRTLQGLGL